MKMAKTLVFVCVTVGLAYALASKPQNIAKEASGENWGKGSQPRHAANDHGGRVQNSSWPPAPTLDPRYIASNVSSTVMLQEAYLDQPYCAVAQRSRDGNWSEKFRSDEVASTRWVCVITADKYHEGGEGENVVR